MRIRSETGSFLCVRLAAPYPINQCAHATFRIELANTFWLEPAVELAHNYVLGHRQISAAFRLLKENEDEIRAAWKDHFGRRGE